MMKMITAVPWELIAAAVIPALFLMSYIYRHDKLDKEPPALLGKLILGGVFAALAAIAGEWFFAEYFLPLLSIRTNAGASIAMAVMVGCVEELCKFFFLRRYSWNHLAFNYVFDGIVYAVFVSLGFAAFENISYVMQFGLSIALPRGFLAVPAHLAFAVFMGSYYGRAKYADRYGDVVKAKREIRLGCITAILLHAFYDAAAMIGTSEAFVVFAVFVLAMYVIVYRKIKNEARQDRRI